MEEKAPALIQQGLSSQEAEDRLSQYGPNDIQEIKTPFLLRFLSKFWNPISWMLEATFILQESLGKHNEALITLFLLIFNAIISFTQETRAQSIVELLKKKLQIRARVLRDQKWSEINAHLIVPGDIIRIRMGDFIPADIQIIEGSVLVDQSMLTGESIPVDLSAKATVFSGSLIKRGEATGLVIATGKRSFFGKTVELVETAHSKSEVEKIVFKIVESLIILDGFLVTAIFIYSALLDKPFAEVIPFALVLLIASVPVAMPATFTLMNAVASLYLSGCGILVTKLNAIEEAAAMQVLYSDKTGTLTYNQLELVKIVPTLAIDEDTLLRYAALASNQASQDPIDMAILSLAEKKGLLNLEDRLAFTPFDPQTRRSEALIKEQNKAIHIIKGAPATIASLTHSDIPSILAGANQLAMEGNRILGLAIGEKDELAFAGFLVFFDPPREEAKPLIDKLQSLGIKLKIITGDIPATAKAVASKLGLNQSLCPKEEIHTSQIQNFDIFADVFPEDKLYLVKVSQSQGLTVGMTGDGVNDAPALRQANIGIAVSNATDVAKSAASIILTKPGMKDVIKVVETGREVYRRMLTYTLNKIVKTLYIALFLSLGLLFTDVFVTTPRLMMFLIFANDFVTMSLASDRVRLSPAPCHWKMRFLLLTSLSLALCWLIFSFALFFLAKHVFHLSLPAIQTWNFLLMVFSGLATVYLIRNRERFWTSPPGKLLLISTIGDILAVSMLAYFGILMEPLGLNLILFLLASVFFFMVILDKGKSMVLHLTNQSA